MAVSDTAELLGEVFPGTRLSRKDCPEYLSWLYEQSPFGPVVECNHDDEAGRAGHYAVVPIALSVDGFPQDGALSLNTAVHERLRGQGMFVKLAKETYAKAQKRGIQTVLGVANANSTPGFVGRLDFELITSLPTRVLLPTPGQRIDIRSTLVDSDTFDAGAVADGIGKLLAAPTTGIARSWTTDTLRWRLSSPGARYALHRAEDVVVITCEERWHGVRFAVLLKVFAAAPLTATRCRGIIRAVCRFHRAPFALHVGLNDVANFRGVPLPERLRPTPLNLICRSLDGSTRSSRIAQFEFLDFDAY